MAEPEPEPAMLEPPKVSKVQISLLDADEEQHSSDNSNKSNKSGVKKLKNVVSPSRFSKKLASRVGTVSSNVLTAYMGFKDPKKRKREYLIPKDKAAWLEWMVHVAKKRVNVEYLTDKELRKVIIRARPNLSPYKKAQGPPVVDPDLPPCLAWNEQQVGDWIASIGWPQLRDTFVKNMITGRKLVLIDCTALNKMGMTDLSSMREVAGKVREVLGIPLPNQMRPLMRIAPFERFLRRRVYNGRSYDELTFEKFCEAEGFNYELVAKNRNMLIPCTAEVTITTPDHADADEEGGGGDSDEDHSLRNAPTVEFLVRNALVRNRTVDQIMEDIMESVFLPPRERKYGKDVWGQLKRGIGEGYDDLHLHYPKQRVEFAAGVAHSLIDELYKTVAVLNDINELEKYINENITKDDMDMFRSCAQTLMEEALPLVGLLALGELDLESVFRQEPEFQQYVDGIVREAEKRTNELVPDAKVFVDEVIAEALKRVAKLDLSNLEAETQKSLLKMTDQMASHLTASKSDTGTEAGRPGNKGHRGRGSVDHSKAGAHNAPVAKQPQTHAPKHPAAKEVKEKEPTGKPHPPPSGPRR